MRWWHIKYTAIFESQTTLKYVDNWLVYCDNEVTEISIKTGTVGISDYAFINCKSLTEIIIPEGVLYLGNRAFMNCDSLQSVSYPDTLQYIGDYSFHYVYGDKEITIPAGVSYLSPYAISSSSHIVGRNNNPLECINVDSRNKYFKSVDGVLYTKNMKALVKYPPAKCDENNRYIIPDGVTEIKSYTFYSCDNLEKISIPESVVEISGYYALFTGENITIYGYKGSAAEEYVNNHDSATLTFKSLGELSKNVAGDINNNGEIDITDAVLLQKYLLAVIPFTEEQWIIADMNNNSVDVFNLVLLKRELLNM